MNIRPKTLLIISMLLLLSLALSACERERPPATVAPTVAPRGTVAPSPTPPAAAAQATLPAVTETQATPASAAGATPTAPAPQQVVVSPGASAGSGDAITYTVQAGDTLAAIAQRYNVTQEAIAQLNNLADPDALTVGQALKIPGSASGSGATTAAAPAGASVYVVQSGDTLAAIARRFGTTVAELVRLNNMSNPDRISVGQRLTVPAAGSTTTAPASGGAADGQSRTHVIAAGDTLLSIAQRYGVTVKAIQEKNNITNPDRIYPGQVLQIP